PRGTAVRLRVDQGLAGRAGRAARPQPGTGGRRGLATWGAPKWPARFTCGPRMPPCPNIRSAPAGRSSVTPGADGSAVVRVGGFGGFAALDGAEAIVGGVLVDVAQRGVV